MLKHRKIILFFLIAATTLPFFTLLIKPQTGFLHTLGSTFGIVGVILMYWQFILGIRFISTRFSNDLIWLNKLHKNMGIYGSIFIFSHPILEYMIYSLDTLGAIIFLDFSTHFNTYASFGKIAFILFVIIWVSSAILRKKLKYRPWLYIHYLAYPLVFFALLHSYQIGTYLNSISFLRNIWLAMTYAFGALIIYRLAKFLNWNKAKYKLINKTKVGEDVFVYKLKAQNKHLLPKVGQFCYLQIGKFAESHPFTVMQSDVKSKTLTFGIKAQGKFTKALSQLEKGKEFWVDGPYGVYTLEGQNTKPKVILAGGIGITPFVDLVEKYSNEDTYMFYANRYLNNAVKRDLFKDKLNDRYYDVIDHEEVEGKNIIKGFLNETILKKTLPSNFFKKANFFICGSPGFYNAYKNLLLSLGVEEDRIYFEEFGL